MNTFFFSIVIPVYNRATLLPLTIDTVLNQTFTDFEIIIIDDGSTDDTKHVIADKYGKNEKVKYFYQTNRERGAARNYGFKKTNGQFVLFFDSDDIMYPNHLFTLHETILRFPQINFLATKYDFLRNGKRHSSTISFIHEGWYDINLFLKGGFFGCLYCIRKNNSQLFLFEENRKYAVLEDWMFLIQNLVNEKIYLVDKVTISVVDHSERSMQEDNQQIIQKRLLATDWIIKNVKLDNSQIIILKGYSYYFCAIHGYLDDNRIQALKYYGMYIRHIGPSFMLNLLLLIKIIVGKKIISAITKNFQ